MSKFKVTNNKTGEEIIINWDSEIPPNNSDIQKIFIERKGIQQPQQLEKNNNIIEFPLKEAFRSAITPISPFQSKVTDIQKNSAVTGLALDYAQGATYGYAKPLLKKAGINVPETSRLSKIVGQTTGAITSPANILLGGGGAISQIAKAGLAGATYNPSETNISGLKERIPGAILGAGVTGVVTGVGTGMKGISNLIIPESKNALKRALKAPKNDMKFDRNLDLAMPEIKKVADESKIEINNLEIFNDMVLKTKNKFWDMYKTILNKMHDVYSPIIEKEGTSLAIKNQQKFSSGQRVSPDEIGKTINMQKIKNINSDGNEIADEIMNSIPEYTRDMDIGETERIEELANKYRKDLSPQKLESYLQHVNKQIAGYYRKSKFGQYTAMSDDMLKAKVSESIALRRVLYKKIEEITGENVRPIKEKLGALMDIYDVGLGRVNVYQRQSPVNLQEAMNYASAMGNIFEGIVTVTPGNIVKGLSKIGFSRIIKKINDGDTLIESAFKSPVVKNKGIGNIRLGMMPVGIHSGYGRNDNK